MPGSVPACRGRNIKLGGYQTKTEVEIKVPKELSTGAWATFSVATQLKVGHLTV